MWVGGGGLRGGGGRGEGKEREERKLYFTTEVLAVTIFPIIFAIAVAAAVKAGAILVQ